VKEVYTLSSDGKSIAQSEIKENGETKQKNVFSYTSRGAILWERGYTSASAYIQTDYAYDYTLNIDEEVSAYTVTVSRDGVKESYGYNILGQNTSYKNGNDVTTVFEYDMQGRLKRTVHPDGRYSSNSYNFTANTITQRNERGGRAEACQHIPVQFRGRARAVQIGGRPGEVEGIHHEIHS
jgi:YD repeat-containing protein